MSNLFTDMFRQFLVPLDLAGLNNRHLVAPAEPTPPLGAGDVNTGAGPHSPHKGSSWPDLPAADGPDLHTSVLLEVLELFCLTLAGRGMIQPRCPKTWQILHQQSRVGFSRHAWP